MALNPVSLVQGLDFTRGLTDSATPKLAPVAPVQTSSFAEVLSGALESLNRIPKPPSEVKGIPAEMKALLDYQRLSHELGLRVEMVTKVAEAGASSVRRLSQS